MHNPESVLEHKTNKLLWDFDIQTDHLISARRPDIVIFNPPPQKKKRKRRICRIVDFAVPAEHGVKLKESTNKDRYLGITWELKKLEHESDRDTSSNWCTWYCHKRIGI